MVDARIGALPWTTADILDGGCVLSTMDGGGSDDAKTTPIRRESNASDDWAGVESTRWDAPLESFLGSLAAGLLDEHTYGLFDWALPTNYKSGWMRSARLPSRLFGTDLNLPNTFWPSLFAGRARSRAAVHVDARGTSFAQLLTRGAKHWRIWPATERALLHETTSGQTFSQAIDRSVDRDGFVRPPGTRIAMTSAKGGRK